MDAHVFAWHLRYALASAGLCRHNFEPIQGSPGFYGEPEVLHQETVNGVQVTRQRQHGRNKDGVAYTVDRTEELT